MNKEKDIEFQERLLTALADFISKRGWKLKIAKKEPTEQSLFIHSINELGVVKNYLQIHSHPFNEPEITKLYIASITHDCEKETDEWQKRLRIGEKPPHHTNPEYAKRFIDELLEFLQKKGEKPDFDKDDINDIVSSQPLHMKAASKSPHIVFDEISRKHKSERWSEIAHLVDLFDDIISKESVESVIGLLNKDEYRMLSERLEFVYHKISNVRGILTSLLHKACEKSYEKHGFVPFLYYSDGTLYFRRRKYTSVEEIDINEIKSTLISVFEEFLSKIDPESEIASVIGRPQTKMLLMPEFIRKESIYRYFVGIRRKYKNTRKPDKTKLKELIEYHFDSIKNAKEELNLEHIRDDELIDTLISDYENIFKNHLDFCSEFRLILNASISRPQQYMFQFFKEIVYEILKDENEFQIAAKTEYDSIFGEGAYELLKSKSTTMPYPIFDKKKNTQLPGDFERYIWPYWKTKRNGKDVEVEKLSLDEQEELLAEYFSTILKNNLGKCKQLPKDVFFKEIAELLISDIIYPIALPENVSGDTTEMTRTLAEKEVASIGESKEKLFNKTKGKRLCPLCHKLMSSSNSLLADLLSNEQGIAKVFNNQAVGAGQFQTSVNICLLCHAELLIRRALLGKTPSDIVILFPSLNFAKIQSSKVLETMKNLQNKLGQFYSHHNPNLNERIKLNDFRQLTTQILEKRAEEISTELDSDKFIGSFKVSIYKNEKQKELKNLQDKLKKLYDPVEDFNNEFGTSYKAYGEIAEAIFERAITIPKNKEPELNQIIEESEVNPIRYSFVYETPNFILISLPITFSYDKDEAEVNILLKRLLFASYLYLLTDCAVTVIPGKEIIHIPQTRKTIYVQPNATLRSIIKEDWISLFDIKKWMVAISAAVKLAYEGGYSGRSGIFEVLMQPTVGHILSRVTSQKTQAGAPRRSNSKLINILDKLQNTEVLKNEAIVDTKIRAV